ncbi:2-succinyl-5-enolpyruvyl-6-hydroxy-3-cyclohexene-1-carboxylic-acid synthase [Corallincola holothuriorum]|uniref:2-succinyl-5-enolpyruvyl-6-hydroxy-3-cyclohexene-1-carboxylate synthase n=1 Tax=Corallincola holothuriorum TaxID=2282215 RepID=A0A368NJN9_9GAMM|nr:2-succinyl-5-enolpyruvyl-6-hydroxy-3-cyclohexene-1-carboxylic-acid synthase [Corallincola holothuriorum]RCU49985.1 2-succinyl-5-enolpyruvyl-6-hydroxy-3-cyclohexene-1-carboxylic-acid synthase [Corallincola holothuriorum]
MSQQTASQTTAWRNQRWSLWLVESLYQAGVQHVVIAPGSRSAPLALAFAQHPDIQRHTHFDERGAGFLALGLAKASGRPVAIVVTSGSAVANLLPAVVEAYQTGIPLVLLTADRPAELIDCGANQAIQQRNIFGSYVSEAIHLPPADEFASSADKLASYAKQLIQRIRDHQAAPIHINCPFREPLYISPEQQNEFAEADSEAATFFAAGLSSTATPTPVALQPDWLALSQQSGLIIAGAMTAAEACAVKALAKQLGWPLLADLQSQSRDDADSACYFDLWLSSADAQQIMSQPALILQFGGRLVSKRLMQALATTALPNYWLVSPSTTSLDPLNKASRQIRSAIAPWCQAHSAALPAALANDASHAMELAQQINRREQQAQQQIQRLVDDSCPSAISPVTEISVTKRLAETMTQAHRLMTGNSLPVRLLELFSGHLQAPLYSNRGASGIDGLLATAVGIAKATPHRPLALLIGDMSLLHDLNSLALLSKHQGPLAVVVLNNDGGNIFQILPVPDHAMKPLFQQPTHWQLADVCKGFALNYQQPSNTQAFSQQLTHALSTDHPVVIEVMVEPGQSVAQLKQLFAAFNDHDLQQGAHRETSDD